MLPLTVLSACAAILALPVSVSAAPLPLGTSELQQPAGLLAAPPGQAFATHSRPLSDTDAASGRVLRVARGAALREADYAVNMATAFRTAVPPRATSAVQTPTVLSRRSASTFASSSASGNKTRTDDDEVLAPAALASQPKPKPSPAGLFNLDYAPGKGSSAQPLLKTDSLSGVNNALAAPHAAAAAPGPEARPKLAQTDRTLAQDQTTDGGDAPPTVPRVDGSTVLAQVNAEGAPVLTVTKGSADTVPQVEGLGTNTGSGSGTDASAPREIDTVSAESHARRGALGLSHYLSGSTLYPDSDAGSPTINQRGVESSLLAQGRGRGPRRGARVKNSQGALSLLGRAVHSKTTAV